MENPGEEVMPIECETQESGDHSGLWKARVKGAPEATGYGYSEAEAARAAIENIVPAMNGVIHRLRARVAELEGMLSHIANHPHCTYPDNLNPYKTGVADGHRCAANEAKRALSAPCAALEAVHHAEEKP